MSKLTAKIQHKNFIGTIVVITVVIVGYRLLFGLHAQGPYTSTEAENGTVTGLASVQSSSISSGSKFVQFGSTGGSGNGQDYFSLTPGSGTYQTGSNIVVALSENSSDSVNTVQANINFNTTQLQFVSVVTGASANSPFNNCLQSGVSTSTVQIACSMLSSTVTGSQNVATITFKVLASSGTTSLIYDSADTIVNPVTGTNNWNQSTAAGSYIL